MFRTAAVGNVGSRYADEVAGVSQGTVIEEQDKNIVQEELVAAVIGAGLSIETSPGTVENQLLEAIEKLVAERGKQLGELFYLDSDTKAVIIAVSIIGRQPSAAAPTATGIAWVK